MAVICRFFIGLAAVNLILHLTCVSANSVKSPARVLIIQDRSVEDGYKVEIESFGEKRELQLLPLENIWSDFAQALHFKRNGNGEKIYEREDIPKDLIIYHDKNKGSFVSVRDGKINGILDSDYVIKSELQDHYLMRSIFEEQEFDKNDFRIVKELPIKSYPTGQNIDVMNSNSYHRASDSYTAEVAVIIDSRLSNLLGSDTDVYDYLTIFWNGVNARFQTIDSPQINIRLVGCVIMRNSEDEPFIKDNQVENDYLLGDNTLNQGAIWIHENLATLPDHDIMYIQSGLNLIDEDGSTGLAGIAFVGGACRKNVYTLINSEAKRLSVAVGLGEDVHGVFRGVHTCAHEIGHNLGAPHDNDTDSGTGDCLWDDGFLMSYVGGSINKLFFSHCSKDMMTEYLSKSVASCTTENLSETKPAGVYTSSKLPGDMVTMTEQCQEITGHSNAFVYSDVDPESKLCYNLQCIFQQGEYYYLWDTNTRAAEGSECPSGKHCSNGECI